MTENVTEEKDLSPGQLKAIEALLTCGNAVAAAKAAGVARRTLYRWMQDPLFVDALRAAEADAVKGLSRLLAGLGESAGLALSDALAPGQKITVRLRAAEIVFGNLLRLRELVDLEARITALESNEQA